MANEIALINGLVAAERQCYLCLMTPSALGRTTLFAKPHQSVLRLLCNQPGVDPSSLLVDYYRNPEKRLSMFMRCQESLMYKQLSHANYSYKPLHSRAAYRRSVQDAKQKFRRLARHLGTPFVSFTTETGFGVFKKGIPTYCDGRTFVRLPDCSMASMDAMEYFAFSNHSDPYTYYLQVPCIDLFGATFYQHIINDMPPGCRYTWWEQRAVEEIREITQDSTNSLQTIRMTHELFMSHELGHSLRISGKAPILDIGKECALHENNMFRGGLPTKYQIDSWSRISEGRGSALDMSFVLGDLLANATVWLAGATENTLRMLRAFTWLLIRPPAEKAICPRGNITFLRYSGQDDKRGLMNALRLIFQTAQGKPADLARLLLQQQSDDWRTLESMYRR